MGRVVDTATGEIIDRLDDNEAARLGELEQIIHERINAFVEVGQALQEIRDSRLYREEHATFEDYCLKAWDITRSYGYRLIEAAEVVAEMSPIGDTPLPANEAQARALKDLPTPEAKVEVMREAAEDGPPTAKKIREVIEQRTERETVAPQFKGDPMKAKVEKLREDDPAIRGPHLTGQFSTALTSFLNIARKLDPIEVASFIEGDRDGARIERLTAEAERWIASYRSAPTASVTNLRSVQ